MNTVLHYLETNRTRLGLDQLGLQGALSSVVLTPRFRASRHVVVLILAAGEKTPRLVAKLPRIVGDDGSVTHEARSLEAAGGEATFDAVPRVIAFERVGPHSMLIETALVGKPITRSFARRHPERYVTAVLNWLDELPTPAGKEDPAAVFERLIAQPMTAFDTGFKGEADHALVSSTLELLEPLRRTPVPAVFEHGDLSPPNIIALSKDRFGVIDFELAESNGLPGHDLAFAITYLAFARERAETLTQQLKAFENAFLEPAGWARPIMFRYLTNLGIPHNLLTVLLVSCFARYTAGLYGRLSDLETDGLQQQSTEDWLRQNRYYGIWRLLVKGAQVEEHTSA